MARFECTAILGMGIIGGSMGMALKRKISGMTIFGVDDTAVLDEALALGVIDKGFTKSQMNNCLAQADLVFLCTPISEIFLLLPEVSRVVRPGTLVTDVGSTKNKIVEEANKYFSRDTYFIGGHPMTGGENSGIQWADALLFENTIYILTPSQKLPISLTQDFGNLIEQIGAKVLFLSPTLHDKIAAAVSHLPQLVAVALMNLTSEYQHESSHFLKLAAGGFRDMTRIAASSYEIWKDIFLTNRDEISSFLDKFIENLLMTKQKLIAGNLAEDFKNAAHHRLSIPRDTKGFFRPHFDLSVRVEDRPGVIAAISTTLAEEGINIKDIELLKVREGDAGILRLSLETQESRQKAQELLRQIGYSARLRN